MLTVEDQLPTIHAIDRLLVAINTTNSLLGGGSGGTQTITSSSETGSTNSPVATGASSVGFTTNSAFVGTINGIARNASTFYSFTAKNGETLPAIPFTVTAGSMIIDKIV